MTSSTATIEVVYVTDTHALIWYLKQDKKLGKSASAIFDAAEQSETIIIISAITIAELYWMDKKWGVFADFAQTYADLKAKPYFEMINFVADDVLEFSQDSTISEMHDRIIVGLARRLSAPLITADAQITSAAIVPIVW